MPKRIPIGHVPKGLLLMNIVVALIYLSWWFLPGHVGNPVLYGLLVFGEIYHVTMSILFWLTVWPRSHKELLLPVQTTPFLPPVAIFITVAGEPEDVVQQTIIAAQTMHYPNKTIYILNDGLVAGKDNWQAIINLAQRTHVNCITRTEGGGAKAGNINNALATTTEPYVAIFDADMMPHADFLDKVMPYFQNPAIGFVQTPQFYKNAPMNVITQGAWEQQSFFFGPIMYGKSGVNAAFICGTNVVITRNALNTVGGMDEKSIAEDFLTSIKIHKAGYQSVYVPEILSEGLAPEDMLSYYKQQLRWARGSLEVLLVNNPLIQKGLTLAQRREYLNSALIYCNGIIVLIDIIMPLIFLFFGIIPVASTTITFALFFFPFMFLNLYTLYLASGNTLTFRAMSFSQSCFTLQLLAEKAVITRQRSAFAVTSKKALQGNFLRFAYPHLLYIALAALAIAIRVSQSGINPSVMTNIAWATFNATLFLPFIIAASPWHTNRELHYAQIEASQPEVVHV